MPPDHEVKRQRRHHHDHAPSRQRAQPRGAHEDQRQQPRGQRDKSNPAVVHMKPEQQYGLHTQVEHHMRHRRPFHPGRGRDQHRDHTEDRVRMCHHVLKLPARRPHDGVREVDPDETAHPRHGDDDAQDTHTGTGRLEGVTKHHAQHRQPEELPRLPKRVLEVAPASQAIEFEAHKRGEENREGDLHRVGQRPESIRVIHTGPGVFAKHDNHQEQQHECFQCGKPQRTDACVFVQVLVHQLAHGKQWRLPAAFGGTFTGVVHQQGDRQQRKRSGLQTCGPDDTERRDADERHQRQHPSHAGEHQTERRQAGADPQGCHCRTSRRIAPPAPAASPAHNAPTISSMPLGLSGRLGSRAPEITV